MTAAEQRDHEDEDPIGKVKHRGYMQVIERSRKRARGEDLQVVCHQIFVCQHYPFGMSCRATCVEQSNDIILIWLDIVVRRLVPSGSKNSLIRLHLLWGRAVPHIQVLPHCLQLRGNAFDHWKKTCHQR